MGIVARSMNGGQADNSCVAGTVDALSDNDTNDICFVLGAPRSGTSWLLSILDSHSKTLCVHEPFRHGAIGMKRFMLEKDRRTVESLRSYFLGFAQVADPRTMPPPYFMKGYGSVSPMLLKAAWVCSKFSIDWPFKTLGTRAVSGATLTVVKDEASQQALSLAESLHAKVVIICRDPLSCVDSWMRGQAMAVMPKMDRNVIWKECEAIGSAIGLTRTGFANASEAEIVAVRWATQYVQCRLFESRSDNCFWIRYEDLYDAAEANCRRLFDSLGVSWEQGVADFLASSTTSVPQGIRSRLRSMAQGKRSYYSLVRSSDRRIVRRDCLSPPEIAGIAAMFERVAAAFQHIDFPRISDNSTDAR